MTDNEIIKGLECCSLKHKGQPCEGCPAYDIPRMCMENLMGEAIDLINRQKAEIERLNAKTNFKANTELYGGYAIIKTDFSNSPHLYKIVNKIYTNSYCDTPICVSSKPYTHKNMEPVLNVIHCGIDETEVVRVAIKDCNEIIPPVTAKSEAIKEFAEQLKKRFYLLFGHCVVDIPQINNLVKEMTK